MTDLPLIQHTKLNNTKLQENEKRGMTAKEEVRRCDAGHTTPILGRTTDPPIMSRTKIDKKVGDESRNTKQKSDERRQARIEELAKRAKSVEKLV